MSRTNRAVIKVGDNDTNSYIVSEAATSSFGPAAQLSTSNINLFGGGKVGIGTILENGALLTVNGDASISGELRTAGKVALGGVAAGRGSFTDVVIGDPTSDNVQVEWYEANSSAAWRVVFKAERKGLILLQSTTYKK